MTEPTIQSLFDLTGKVALITGGSGYLGKSFSRALAEAGASVVIASRVKDRAEQVASELPSPGGAVHFGVQLDQLDEASLSSGFDVAIEAAGHVDILINNGQQGHPLDLTDVTGEAFSEDLKNVTGYFLLARRFRDHIVAREASGAVVMIGSMYGVVGSYPDAYEGICTA
ncbi:MAG: SDR family NAD(P)-dependent oxidoreductase, partial [Planctomycetaceae bacterium]|nr:SDR family NAD(P)-dependent oxidoreductase [Planctomycetaceae bacterium]